MYFVVFTVSFILTYYFFRDCGIPKTTVSSRAYRFFKRKKDWSDIADHVRLDDQMLKADKALYAADPEFAVELGYVPPELERVKCKDCGQEEYKKDMDYYNPIPHDYKGYYKDSDELLCRPCLEKRNEKKNRMNRRICIGCNNEIIKDMPCPTCEERGHWKMDQVRKRYEKELFEEKQVKEKLIRQMQYTTYNNIWWGGRIM